MELNEQQHKQASYLPDGRPVPELLMVPRLSRSEDEMTRIQHAFDPILSNAYEVVSMIIASFMIKKLNSTSSIAVYQSSGSGCTVMKRSMNVGYCVMGLVPNAKQQSHKSSGFRLTFPCPSVSVPSRPDWKEFSL